MLLNGISSDRRPLELAVPKMLISPTRIKYCTILSSLHKEFEILVFEEMQLLCVCTKQGTKKILFLSSNSTLCGSCVRRIADTRLREKRQVLFVANMLLCCSHTFEFANTSWPTIAFFRVKAALMRSNFGKKMVLEKNHLNSIITLKTDFGSRE